jgi:DNA-binding HxlR family transcriptional regulator
MKLEKITDAPHPPQRRRYDDACGAAHALDIIGERWALLVMRELMLGAKRFGDLRDGLPGISANVLTQRLEGLEIAGVLVRKKLPPPVSAQVYELTEWGYQSEPILGALGRWAARSPTHDASLPFSSTAFLLSLRAMFAAKRAEGLSARIGFRIGAETFLARLADGRLPIARGALDEAEVVFTGPTSALAAVVYGGVPLATLEAAGALQVTGDHALAERFVGLFPLPPKAAVTPPPA